MVIMIDQQVERSWGSAVALVNSMEPHVTTLKEAVQQADAASEACGTRLRATCRSLYDLGKAPHGQVRAAAARAAAQIHAALAALALVEVPDARVVAAARAMRLVIGTVGIEPYPTNSRHSEEALYTWLTYDYWRTNRPAELATFTDQAGRFAELAGEVASQVAVQASDDVDKHSYWVLGVGDPDREPIVREDWQVQADVLANLTEAHPPEGTARPSAIDYYVLAREAAHLVGELPKTGDLRCGVLVARRPLERAGAVAQHALGGQLSPPDYDAVEDARHELEHAEELATGEYTSYDSERAHEYRRALDDLVGRVRRTDQRSAPWADHTPAWMAPLLRPRLPTLPARGPSRARNIHGPGMDPPF
jgi:hypothetical protein